MMCLVPSSEEEVQMIFEEMYSRIWNKSKWKKVHGVMHQQRDDQKKMEAWYGRHRGGRWIVSGCDCQKGIHGGIRSMGDRKTK